SDEMKYDEQQYMQEIAGDIYGKRHDKYILMKLEYLESEQNVVRKYGTISVEHVLPQNPKDDSQWKKDFSDADRVLYTNKICNLVLLSKKKNSSASNYDFEDKKKKYLEGRITDLGRSQKILSESSWNPKVLNERQEKILDILKKNGQ
ncbi:MAG: HNH endonuclease family protein, partial [Lachnospiraceae bacterium]|nr:HNH endonuclease family protein [Lachnospiraceae bacterium]